jgi:HSP20 family protein
MTTLVRWTPFRELDMLERRMRRMFEDVGFGPVAAPTADVYETPKEFVVELEVPGFTEKDIGLEITDHTLVIKGEVKDVREEKEKTFLLHERLEKTFERRFHLPEEADTEKLAATFAHGVLEVHAPKLATAAPRTIAISAKK